MTLKLHKRTRSSYWCNSKLLSWMLPEEDKQPLSFDKLKEKWSKGVDPRSVAERVIDGVQDTVMFPVDLVYSIKIYIKNSKGNTHVLDGGLNKGQWYDLTYRIPHCLFYELEKFIEKEKGLDVLEWEKNLTYNEDWGVKPDNPKFGKLTSQALAAIEQEEIYKWWKDTKDNEELCLMDNPTLYEKETEMLVRLIKIRDSLWT